MLALEGGYVGPAVAGSVVECLKVLLGDPCTKVSSSELERLPSKQATLDLSKTIGNLVNIVLDQLLKFYKILFCFQLPYWPVLRDSSKWINVSHLNYLDTHPLDIASIQNLQV